MYGASLQTCHFSVAIFMVRKSSPALVAPLQTVHSMKSNMSYLIRVPDVRMMFHSETFFQKDRQIEEENRLRFEVKSKWIHASYLHFLPPSLPLITHRHYLDFNPITCLPL